VQWIWTLDQEVFRAIHVGLHREWLDPVFWIITSTGLGWVQALAILTYPLLFGLRAHYGKPAKWHHAVFLLVGAAFRCWRNPVYYAGPLLATVAVSGLFFAQGVKRFIAPRERPSMLEYAAPQEGFFHNSFPSGHTTTSFALAFMLVFLTRGTDRRWIGNAALVWALLVGISRIYRGVHWPSDVLGGLFFGLAAACLVQLVLSAAAKSVDPEEAGVS
jgi:membrane-associated phospholipid phosphatase